MAEGEKLENPFAAASGPGAKEGDRDGFLSFSSSTPRGSPSGGGPRGFRPKWGKKNRQDNWNRFGQYDQQQQQMNMSAPDGELESATYLVISFLDASRFRNGVAVTRRPWRRRPGLPRLTASKLFPQLPRRPQGDLSPLQRRFQGRRGPSPSSFPFRDAPGVQGTLPQLQGRQGRRPQGRRKRR